MMWLYFTFYVRDIFKSNIVIHVKYEIISNGKYGFEIFNSSKFTFGSYMNISDSFFFIVSI